MPILGIIASSRLSAVGDYESIATVTPYTTTSTVVFNSIPGTFKHLQIRCNGYGSAGVDYQLQLNGNSGSRQHTLVGNGSAASAGTSTGTASGQYMNDVGVANYPVVMIVDILDYTNTNKNKTVKVLGGTDLNGSGRVWLISQLFEITAAVTSITINAGSLASGAHFALYGIKG